MKKVVGERGVALVTVLLFTALMFILVTTMLSTLGNEALVSGGHRDSVRAFEHAQAGLEEGVRRVEAGRPYAQGFTGSLAPGITVEVVDIQLGQGGAAEYMEVQSNATVGLARRRLSALLLAQSNAILSKIIFGYSLASQGAAQITGGDVYSQTYVTYKTLPSDPATVTYAAWAIEKVAPGPIPWCYTYPCSGQPNWRPAMRRAEYRDAQFRPVGTTLNPVTDTRTGAAVLNFTCPAGPPAPYDNQSVQTDGVALGFVNGDKRADTNAIIPPGPPLRLYGCDPVDNRPYTWVRETPWKDKNNNGTFDSGEDDVDGDGQPDRLWMKTVVYEDWFAAYWCFNADPAVLAYEKCNGLDTDPGLGAIPPFPNFDVLDDNYDQYQTGGGVINASSPLDFGCKDPEMSCPGGASTPKIVLLDNGDYKINANLRGYGILLVDGDLEVNGTLEYWGMMVVRGKLTLGSGNVIVHGGLIAQDTAEITGSIIVDAGITLANRLLGPATVTRKVWWER